MNLNSLRNEISAIDEEILRLFIKRMGICGDVASHKIENKLPVFQSEREREIIKKVRDASPEWLKNSAEVLFNSIMDISKCKQQQQIFSKYNNTDRAVFSPEKILKIGCQGTQGAYSHTAAQKLFTNAENEISFFETFEDVFSAVNSDEIEFGLLPIQNSTAGSVYQTYELLRKYELFISASVSVKVSHCLCVKKGSGISDISKVFSHEQALLQCSDFIKENGLEPVSYPNTALAGEFVKDKNGCAAICSEECAMLNGLDILNRCISNADENYTRFICVSKKIFLSENADIISVSLSLPHMPSALYRLLTKFSVIGLNLLRIESKPIASKDFDVIFYLDFEGSIKQPEVLQIIEALKSELSYFKFLGNYSEVK
ncbi:MAG: prephenate dehydratase domain-containing protein [Oscillospiraceae bacterium]